MIETKSNLNNVLIKGEMIDMVKIFMTTQEKKIVDSIIDSFSHSFWEYGDKEACFKEDSIMMILLALRHKEI